MSNIFRLKDPPLPRETDVPDRQDIHAVDSVVIHELAQHETHDFHGDTGATVRAFSTTPGRDDAFSAQSGEGESPLLRHASTGHAAHQLLQAFHCVSVM
jgi:hypothetical protein